MSRNNAKFPLEVFSYLDGLKSDPKFKFLKSYQNYLREYVAKFIPSAGKGILVYHGMGLGKSISGACIALEQNKPVIFLMSKSLVNNMKSEIAKYIKLRIEHDPDVVYTARGKSWNAQNLTENVYDFIDDKFHFVSFNASNMKDQLHRILRKKTLSGIQSKEESVSLNGYCLVVDEAHNLFRSIINGSINGTEVYDLALDAKNATMIFLTGTPVNNDPFELSACFNMLDKGCLPDNYHDFKTHFVSEDTIKNKGKFQNRIFGLISFVSNEGLKGIPQKLPTIVRIIPMSQTQYSKYKVARDLEMQEGQGSGRNAGPGIVRNTPSMQKPSSGASSSYRTKSRQFSNYAPPGAIGEAPELEEIDNAKIDSPKFKAIYQDLCSIGPAIIYSQYTGIGGIGAFAKYITARGWQEYNPITGVIGGGNDSNFTLMEKMENGQLSASEYLQCRRSCGKIKGSAESPDNSTVSDSDVKQHKNLSKVFAVISGAVSFDMRKKIEDEANKSDTKIWCILVSSTGAEGLNFLRRRYVGIMEPYWNYARIAQVAARAIRTNSHADLPENERDVQICVYLSVSPDVKYEYHYWNTDELEFDDDFGKDSTTGKLEKRLEDFGGIDKGETDVSLLADSIMDYRAIMSFLRAMQEASFECKISGRANCRVCAPNDTPLFTDKIARDMASDDPCREYEAAQIKAKKIVHDGVEYYYADKKIYRYDPAVQAHREVFENDDAYFEVLKKI